MTPPLLHPPGNNHHHWHPPARQVMELAKLLQIWVVVGSAHRLTGPSAKPHNSLYVINPHGTCARRLGALGPAQPDCWVGKVSYLPISYTVMSLPTPQSGCAGLVAVHLLGAHGATR